MSDRPNTSFTQFVEERLSGSLKNEVERNSAVICAATPCVPVVFVSDTFEAHTGYSRAEIVGQSLSILQGADTEPEAVERFRFLISNGVEGTVRITNYRKDGSKFVHECELRPIHDAQGVLTHIAAIQRPV